MDTVVTTVSFVPPGPPLGAPLKPSGPLGPLLALVGALLAVDTPALKPDSPLPSQAVRRITAAMPKERIR